MDILSCGREVFEKEINAMALTRDSLDLKFETIVGKILQCQGRVIVTGMGKSGHVGRKMAATFSSLGTPAFFMDPAEAMHGDLGMVTRNDVVIMISYSGESNEIREIISGIRYIGAYIIAITGNAESNLAQHADIAQILPQFEEACHLGLAPTSSTTVAMCYGDALAVTLSELKGFTTTEFGIFHPAGALGKSIICRVEDLMASGTDDAVVDENATLKEIASELALKKLGLVNVVGTTGRLKGIISTGDFGRELVKGSDIYTKRVVDVMTKSPKVIEKEKLAVEALNIMRETGIYSMPVVENRIQIGTITMQSILNAGII